MIGRSSGQLVSVTVDSSIKYNVFRVFGNLFLFNPHHKVHAGRCVN